ncbi:PapK protein [Escherichia coli]|nr:PapK protein [Escherichia coli]
MTLTFKGTEEAALPGHLKVTGVNAGRLGIALLDTDGSSLLNPALPITKARGKRLPETVLSFLSARMLWQRRKPCGRRVWYPVIMKQQPRLN